MRSRSRARSREQVFATKLAIGKSPDLDRSGLLSLCARLVVATDLTLDPFVAFLQARSQRKRWLPTKFLLDQPVVGISAANAQRPVDMSLRELLACNVGHDVDELIDGNHLVGSDIDRAFEFRTRQPRCSLE